MLSTIEGIGHIAAILYNAEFTTGHIAAILCSDEFGTGHIEDNI